MWGGNERLGEVQERKLGHRLMRGWVRRLIGFTHLVFAVEYLDPSGLLRCRYRHVQANGSVKDLLVAGRAQFHVLTMPNVTLLKRNYFTIYCVFE